MMSSRLFRLAAGAGLACAVLLVVNVGRRAGVLPDGWLTNTIAPFAALAGVFALTGLYLVQRTQAGRVGVAGYALNLAGLAGAFAIEYTLHFVFPELSAEKVMDLLMAGTGLAFTVTAVVLIVGVLIFGAASWRARVLPAPAIGLYVAGMIPGSLRTAVPVPVFLAGLTVAAIGIAWLSVALWRTADARVSVS
jgi:hypothetical protein